MTVVLIDDLHFAPDEGRALFSSLAMAMPGHRVLLIGSTRPGVSEEWRAGLTRLAQTTPILVPRLGPKDLVRLLRDSFKSEALASSLAAQIAVKSDGNPFFAFEIIRGLREGQFITQKDDGTWVSTQIIDEIEIPSSVLDLVNARVADLSEEERDLLDVACCWGFEFDPLLIGEVLDVRRIPLLKRLGQIERRHRLVRSAGLHYVFDHHQVREALYGSLSELLRREYHAALAEALESRAESRKKDPATLDGALCVNLCEHYLRGARGESGLRYLAAAQTHLEHGYLHAQVVALTERALAVPDLLTGAERAATLLRLGAALAPMGRRARQEECAREAELLAEEAGDEDLRGRAASMLGTVFFRTSRHKEAESVFRRALETATAQGDKKAEAGAICWLGNACNAEGRLESARKHYERYLALCREIGYGQGEAIATGNLGLVFHSQGRLAEAHEQHERHLALSRKIGYRAGEAAAHGELASAFHAEGRLAESRKHRERSLALSREVGDRLRESITTGNLGIVFHTEGRLAAAREHYSRHLALSREVGHREGECIAHLNLADVEREEGECERAEERYMACLAVGEEIGFRVLVAATHLNLGSLRADTRGGEEGRVSLVAALDLAAEIGLPGYETLARCELALLPGGDAEDALAAFTENEERLEASDRREARYLLWRATSDRAHLEEAKRLLDELVAHADADTRESMLTNLRVNRAIMAAWTGESGDGEPRGTESITRVG